jgi:pimeloyl-ACP methyl ester carboxylesterase
MGLKYAGDVPPQAPRTLAVRGRTLEIRCLDAADPSRPTIVMLHEGLGSVSHWRDFPDRLAAQTGCEIVVYSRYGHGMSSVLKEPRDIGYIHEEAEEVLPAVLTNLGIMRPILLGHSDGASIALLYAAKFPMSVSRLILEAPHVFVEDLTLESIAKVKMIWETTDLPRKLARHHADAESTFRGWSDIWLDPCFRSWNIESCLNKIRCPVMVLQGEDDEYATMAQIEAICGRVPDAQAIVLPQCGHAPHRDQPEATLKMIRSFLD